MTQTTQALWEASQRLAQAEQAKRQREQEASQPQREIEQAQRDVERLAAQDRAEQFEHYAAQNDASILAVYAVHTNLIAALEVGDIAGARTLSLEAKRAHEAHVAMFNAAMSAVWSDIEADAQERIARTAVRTYVTDAEAWRTATWAYEKRLHHAYGSAHAVIAWIARSPNQPTAQIRAGFAYALTGALYAAPADYDPLRAYEDERRTAARH